MTYLFDSLKEHGPTFSSNFWELVVTGVLFPIFDDLKPGKSDHVAKFSSKEEFSVWLSTTLIQALRQLIDLFTHNFEVLAFLIDGLLDLLVNCITQGIDFYAASHTNF